MKIQPINTDIQETYMEWEKKKALSTLLKEKGILDEFNKTYIPKD
jgi:CRISPR/Cas system Type II protein with McrA/HNH and RuvC-like nuclease domain